MKQIKNIKTSSIVLLMILLGACSPKPQSDTQLKTDTRLSIKTATVAQGSITDTVSIFGELKLRQEAWLSSQFDGRITEFTWLKGDRVSKNQRAAVIIPARREALLQVADSLPEEYKPILNEQEKPIALYNPVSGVVLEVLRHNGDVVSRGEHIAHIGVLSTLDVQGELPVKYLPAAQKAKKLQVRFTDFPALALSLPIETFTGTVSENQSLIVRLTLPNPKLNYRPGMRVKISFPLPEHQRALLVPRKALVEEEGEYSVFVIENSTAFKKKVAVGILHDDFVEITSGLEANQQVAIEKAYSLKNNMEVNVK